MLPFTLMSDVLICRKIFDSAASIIITAGFPFLEFTKCIHKMMSALMWKDRRMKTLLQSIHNYTLDIRKKLLIWSFFLGFLQSLLLGPETTLRKVPQQVSPPPGTSQSPNYQFKLVHLACKIISPCVSASTALSKQEIHLLKKRKINLINDAELQFTKSIDSRYTGADTLAKIITDKQQALLSVPSAPLLFYCV